MQHPVQPEELMAHLDGESAAGVAEHLEQCGECRSLAADLRGVSTRMAGWKVVPSSPRLAIGVAGGLDRVRPSKRWLWIAGLAAACLGAVVIAMIPFSSQTARQSTYFSKVVPVDAVPNNGRLPGPLVAHAARLGVVVDGIATTRSGLDVILKRHQGYIASLNTRAQAIEATLRVPSTALEAVLTDLKSLGRVENESRNSEEVTREYVDIEARLANSRNTERRLTALLKDRPGELDDVLSIEKEVARVRGEIEQMEAQRRTLANRVEFATIDLTLTEESHAALPGSISARLRAAAAEGVRAMIDSLVGVAQTLLTHGPALLLWSAILFWPARLLWRHVRSAAR